MKILYTLNRQLADKESSENIGEIESYFCTYDMQEMQNRIHEILHRIYVENKDKDVFKRAHSQIARRGSTSDNVYAFIVYAEHTKAYFNVQQIELALSSNAMHDFDLR
jgi:hypothetical protein